MKTQKKIQSLLESTHSIAIFPEGTFTYATGLRPFKTGAFQLAIDTNTPICPLAIKGTRQLLRGGSLLLSPSSIHITACNPITPQGRSWHDVIQLRNETRKILAEFSGEATLDMTTAGPMPPMKE